MNENNKLIEIVPEEVPYHSGMHSKLLEVGEEQWEEFEGLTPKITLPGVSKDMGKLSLESVLSDDAPAPRPVLPLLLERQLDSEASYDISVETAPYGARLSEREIIERMELNHAVKTAPHLDEQIGDSARTNAITSITHTDALGVQTSRIGYADRRVTRTEHEVIDQTAEFLDAAIAAKDTLGSICAEQAQSLRDTLTFIGEKEYQEAAAGIALYWKALLERHPRQQVLVLGDVITAEAGGEATKSDAYLLDSVLAHFTDEEVEKYKGRLITSPAQITVSDPLDLRTALLDDWTISGSQLRIAAKRFCREHPRFASSLEAQLIVASDERITRGFQRSLVAQPDYAELPLPVRAYFRAHRSLGLTTSRTHITGAHSSVDYDFETRLVDIVEQANKRFAPGAKERAVLGTMPPMANIVRPYRQEGVELTQKQRLG